MGKLKKAVGAGIGLGILAVAGAYFLSGKNGKNRQKVKGWVLKVKGEVLDKLKDVKEINQESYAHLVQKVVGRYDRMRKVNKKELKALAGELKDGWHHINQEIAGPNER